MLKWKVMHFNLSLTSTRHAFSLLGLFFLKCFRGNSQDTYSFALLLSSYLQSTPVKRYLLQTPFHRRLPNQSIDKCCVYKRKKRWAWIMRSIQVYKIKAVLLTSTSCHSTIRHTTKNNIHPTRVDHCIGIVVLPVFLRKRDIHIASNCRHLR